MNKGGRNKGKMDGVEEWTREEGRHGAEEWLDGGDLKRENKRGI